jgi:hypothetical protein
MTEPTPEPSNNGQAASGDHRAEHSTEPPGLVGESRVPAITLLAGADQAAGREDDKAEEANVWSIYDALPSDWSQHQTLLARWKQGDLVQDVPLTWLAAPGEDPVTGVGNDRDEVRPAFDRSLRVTAIICSQTCDLGATPPGDSHPFVLLAPLVHESSIPTTADRRLARSGKIGYLVRTLPPPTPEAWDESQEDESRVDGTPEDTEQLPARRPARQEAWFADLRLIFPASKALLLSREPLPGFADEAASLAFAETLALKFRRAALNEVLSEALPQSLRKFVQDNGHRRQEFAKVEQVRILILGGDRLRPDRATLYVLTDGVALTDEERETWTRFQQATETLFSGHGIALAAMVHADVNALSAAKYRESVPVRCDLLGPVHWP